MATSAATATTNTSEKSILCVGMCVLDIIHVCNQYPEEDSDKRSKYGRWQRGGNASNNCTVLAQLGKKCEFLGVFSAAKMFQFVIDDKVERGISIKNCKTVENCDPPLSSVLLNEETGSRTIVHSNPNMPILTFDDFKQVQLDEYEWIHFEGRNPEETVKMLQLISNWNEAANTDGKIKVSLDLEKTRFDNMCLIQYADVVFLGKDLAKHLGSNDMNTAVWDLRKNTRKGYTIICPWGADGIAALDEADNFFSCSSYSPPQIVDTLGAGDTFAAAVIFALSSGRSVEFAIQFGSKIAGEKCGFYGYDQISNIFEKYF